MKRRMWFAQVTGLAIVLFLASAASGHAQAKVTLSLSADGDVAAQITEASLPPGEAGFIVLTVSDDRGLGVGWEIVLSNHSPGAEIALLGEAEIRVLAGQPMVAEGPTIGASVANRTPGTLRTDTAFPAASLTPGTSVLRAAPGAGSGSYALNLAASATRLPNDTIVTLTVGSAP